jgi:polyisoprenoid-binding protein YceI
MRHGPFRTALGVTVLLSAAAGSALAVEYNNVDAAQSKLAFHYTEMGVLIDGGFSKFNAKLNFDPVKPEAAHVVVDIPFATIDAGSSEANSEVTGKEWLDTAHYPTAHFESTGVKTLSAGHYQLAGNLSIKGRTHAVSLPVNFSTKGNEGEFDGTFNINRNDFAIGEGEWTDTSIIANPIQISFKLLATPGK